MKFAVVLVACAVLAGCASKAENIGAAYVSPMTYKDFSCGDISLEAQRLSQRAATAIGAQNQRATNDAVAAGVGVVLFWPALFFIKGEGASALEVARLKGEVETVEHASRMKGCGIAFQKSAARAFSRKVEPTFREKNT